MIETYKIPSGKYDLAAIQNLTTSTNLTTRGSDLRLQNIVQDIICANSFLLIELSICGTVCLMTWCMQNLLTHLNQDWINSGVIRKQVKIIMPKFKELEVECNCFEVLYHIL